MKSETNKAVGPSYWCRALIAVARYIQCGRLTIVTPEGTSEVLSGPQPGPSATLILRHRRAARRILTGGDLGFAEAFMAGDCDSPDLSELVELAVVNEAALGQMLRGQYVFQLARRFWHRLRRNSRQGSKRNIAYHYDLGNEFYARWLDPTMTYSSAVYERPNDDLGRAQTRKYEQLCRLLDLRAGHHVLEIGCGWGGFAEYAARTYDVTITGITLSREQHDYALARAARAGLSERIKIRLQDYRDVVGRFDRIASIEMFEAVGEEYWSTFFDRIRALLAEGGQAALQIITIADERFEAYRCNPDFIQKYIFPGGMLPSLTALRQAVQQASLAWRTDVGFAKDYARTLATWRQRFLENWPDIQRLGFDESFRRMWEYYFCYCASGFRHGAIDVRQIALRRD